MDTPKVIHKYPKTLLDLFHELSLLLSNETTHLSWSASGRKLEIYNKKTQQAVAIFHEH